jgi:hypothetical protein
MNRMRTRRLVTMLFAIAAMSTTLFATPSPANAVTERAHLHGGAIDIGDGTILIDLVCRDEMGQPMDVLFNVEVDGDAVSEEFHCTNIEASGPLGDAEVDLLCVVTWDEWPVDADTHLELVCSMHITIFDQPFPPPTDALCVVTVEHLFAGTPGNDGSQGFWHEDEASELFDSVGTTVDCPTPLPAAINFFIGSGTAVLLHFTFEDLAHLHGGAIDIGDGTILVDLVCRDESGDPVDVLFEYAVDGGAATSEQFHCSNIEASGPLGDAVVDLLCVAVWDDWPVDENSHMALECSMHITIIDPGPPPTELALCVVALDHLFVGTEGNDEDGGVWHADDASELFDSVIIDTECPSPYPGAIDFFIASGTAVLMDFLFLNTD